MPKHNKEDPSTYRLTVKLPESIGHRVESMKRANPADFPTATSVVVAALDKYLPKPKRPRGRPPKRRVEPQASAPEPAPTPDW